MGKVWKYIIHQLGSKSQISGFSALLTAVVILILYSTELSSPLLTPLQAFAENFQGLSSSEIIATNDIAANTNAAHIKAAAANSFGTVIEKVSDKAMYKVQLRFAR